MSDSTGSPDSSGSQAAPDPNLPAWARKQQEALNPLTDERLEAFIGPRWPTYQRKFAQFREDPTFVPSWNWGAAVFGFGWFMYRKLYLAAVAFYVLPSWAFRLLTGSDTQLTMSELSKPENKSLVIMQIAVGVSAIIAAGGVGNWLLFRRFSAAVRIAQLQEIPSAEVLPWLARVGGINKLAVGLVILLSLMTSYVLMRA